MPAPNEAFITAYRLVTKPYRVWTHRRLRRQARVPVTAIFLHRIADDYPNDWSMSINAFDRLIEWLEQNVDLVSTDEAQQLLRNGNRGRIAVNITFDDGYADNCLHAIPTLLKKKIPFTYYVTTDNVRSGQPFPHDKKNDQPLAPNSVEEIQAMADSGVEIGVHTRTHADMGKVLDPNEMDSELGGARRDLENWLGFAPKHFAFPYGMRSNMTTMSIQYLWDHGFSSYCSAYGGYNFPINEAFHFKRFHADPCLARMQNWLSFDPRWMRKKAEFEYTPDRQTRRHVEAHCP